MADQPEILKLVDANVSLYRDVKFMHGLQQVGSGDHMVVSYLTGSQEDIVILRDDAGQLDVKGLVRQIEFTVPASTYASTTSTAGFSFKDLDADSVKRLLAIYKKFPQK